MNWFKILTKSGRQSLAAEAWDSTVTAENVTATVAEQITKVLAESNLPVDKAVSIAERATETTAIVSELFQAAGDRIITYAEADAILTKVFAIFGTNLADTLAALRGKVLEKIP